MARSKRKPSARAKARSVATPSEPEDLGELTSEEAAAPEGHDSSQTPEGKAAADDPDATSTTTDAQASSSEQDSDRGSGGKGGTPAGTKDPVSKKAAKNAQSSKNTGSASAKKSRDEVAEKAKDPARSRSPKKAAAAEGARSGRRTALPAQNPRWLVPTALTLLIVGLAYLVTFYLSAGTLPLPIDDWNLAAGFGIMLVGGGMLMFWK